MRKKWEHKVILSHGVSDERTIAWEEELNRHGADGLELVSVIVKPETPSLEMTNTPRVPRTAVFLKRERID